MLKISHLSNNCIAQKVGLRVDDQIVAFDGKPAKDMLDVAYYDSQADFSVTVLRDNQRLTYSVHKGECFGMGWDFYDECYLTPRWCANKCVFCFVDQLPKGQRPTLYVKDDDWRLSFVSGNFVTLTNISDDDIQRILDKKFSPLYVSVHATEDGLRRHLLGNPNARPILPLLKKLASSGITIYTQVVMVEGLNDAEALQQTMQDLFSLYPAVQNLAVVPVGLTKYRCGLSHLHVVSQQCAQNTILQVQAFDEKCFNATGQHFVYCSDEMYVLAKCDVPPYDYYGDFNQIENGVGLVADFRYQFDLALQDAVSAKPQSFTVVTGVAATPFIQQVLSKAKCMFAGVNVNVATVVNKFFGETVTVAGLVVGQDIVQTLKNMSNVGDVLLLPKVMLKETEDVFLDGMTLQQLKDITGKEIIITADGYELCQAILQCND